MDDAGSTSVINAGMVAATPGQQAGPYRRRGDHASGGQGMTQGSRPLATATPQAAIGYVRVSTQEQAAHGISLDAQEARLRAYAALRGVDLVAVVIDAGVSAGKYRLEAREGGARILAAIKARTVRHVIALKLDRLFRNTIDCLTTVQ